MRGKFYTKYEMTTVYSNTYTYILRIYIHVYTNKPLFQSVLDALQHTKRASLVTAVPVAEIVLTKGGNRLPPVGAAVRVEYDVEVVDRGRNVFFQGGDNHNNNNNNGQYHQQQRLHHQQHIQH